MSLKIIIIGGGIAGLTTAIALKQKGIDSTIYEKSPELLTGGAGLALWPNATSILAKLELLDPLLPYANVMEEMHTATYQGKSLNTINIGKLAKQFHSPTIVLRRRDLQKVLSNAVPASQIKYGKQCITIEQHPAETIVHFSDGTTAVADVVVFCDGIHSMARTSVFGCPPLQYAGRTSWRGVTIFDRPFFDRMKNLEIFGVGKRIGIFPLSAKAAYWFAAVNMPEAEAYEQERTIAGVSAHFKDWTAPVQDLFGNTTSDNLVLTNINYASAIQNLVKNRCVLLGDAAHPMTPDLGQGACQAIEDAFVFAACLGEKQPLQQALTDYQNKRLSRVRAIARDSYRMGKLRQMGNPLGYVIRNQIFGILPEQLVLRMLAKNISFG